MARLVRARYLPALLVVALLAVAGHLALTRVLTLQDDGAAAVNVSGRQRMLSQRIALHVVLLRTDAENERAHRAELVRLIDLMERSQRALLVGDEELGLSATESDQVLDLLTGEVGLDQRVETFLRTAREVTLDPDPRSAETVRRADLLVDEARGPLLEELDAVVGAFQRDAEDDLELMRLVSLVLMIGTLVTVMVEALVVFRPLIRRLGRTTEELAIADTDVVTGLWNRRRLLAELRAEMERADDPTLWVLFCDLDGFKGVNDAYGHDAGDEVLRVVAERLTAALPSDAILGRVGGDEFVVALRRDAAEVEVVAEQIATVARRPVRLTAAGAEVEVGTSVGLAAAERSDQSIDRLLSQADAAMYSAKRDGKGAVRAFDGSVMSHLTQRSLAAAELSAAIADGDLAVRFETIVDPSSGIVVGAEAVVDWDRRGLNPRGLVELTIACGLDSVVASVAIEELRGRLPAIATALGSVPLTVNVTTNDLLDAPTLERLRSLADDADRVGVRLGVDVVEHPASARDHRYLPVLQELRDRGVVVAAEGFGTGPASLVHLGRLPLDLVKVDHAVLSDVLGEDHAEAALLSLVEVARSMQVDVVVQGIDEPVDLERLAASGCVGAQGSAIAPLLSGDELVADRAGRTER